MNTKTYCLLLLLVPALLLWGCKSAPEPEESAFGEPAEISATPAETADPFASIDSIPADDSFGAATTATADSFGGGFGTASSSSMAEDVDRQVLTGGTDGVFIDPGAPAVDSTPAYVSNDGFTPLRPGHGYYGRGGRRGGYSGSYSGSGYSSTSGSSGYSSAKAKGGTYTVKSGDSLWKIAKANGCTVKALCEANNISESAVLRIGKKLTVPGKSSKSSSSAKSSYASGDSYTVQSGDSYYKIGKKFGINYIKLMNANGGSDKLVPGQVIKLP